MDSTINSTFDEGNDEVQMDVAEPIYIPTPKPLALKDFERFWKSTNPELNTTEVSVTCTVSRREAHCTRYGF